MVLFNWDNLTTVFEPPASLCAQCTGVWGNNPPGKPFLASFLPQALSPAPHTSSDTPTSLQIPRTYQDIPYHRALALILSGISVPLFLLSEPYFWGFPGSSAGKESACNARDPGLIPGSGRSPGEGIGYPLQYPWAFLLAQSVKKWSHSVVSDSLQPHGL